VLVWGIDAMVLTFVAPHTLHIRPLVVPRGPELVITNRTLGLNATVLADGQPVGPLPEGASVSVQLAADRSLLATLPEVTFFGRYAATFGR
jgi:NAD kinase